VSTYFISFLVLVCMLGGMALGMYLRRYLPDQHFHEETKDITKTSAGMLATLVALIIGLLVSSSKSAFDSTSTSITEGGAKTIRLDRVLARYGPEAKPIREKLRQSVVEGIEHIWPSDGSRKVELQRVEAGTLLDEVHDMIRELKPHNEGEQYLKTQALELSSNLLQTRWMIIEQSQNPLPAMLLIVLGFWLTTFFASLGLLAPRNLTAFTALFVCALSMAGSLFLILELNRPLEGVIKVSGAPMYKALSLISK